MTKKTNKTKKTNGANTNVLEDENDLLTGQEKILKMISDKLIEKLEKGVNPWRKPWAYPTAEANYENMAVNYFTGKAYNGINQVLLDEGFYLSAKEVVSLGGKIKKGAKGNMIVFSAPKNYYVKGEKKDENGDTITDENGEIETEWQVKKSFILKYYYVFKLEDTEGCREIKGRFDKTEKPVIENRDEKAEEIIKDYAKRGRLIVKEEASDSAFYRPLTHSVVVPKNKQFKTSSAYYATLFHELTHSTGASHLLKRDGIVNWSGFGSEPYAKEELIAEIGSSYACNYLGIATEETNDNSASYLKSWANALKGKEATWFVVNATTKAAEAFKMIFNLEQKTSEVAA